jgi:hypothetical protein
MTKIIEGKPLQSDVTNDRQLARRQAIKQIERKRRYWVSTAISGVGMILLVVIWAVGEYHNAGGWPTQGFSQSSGIHDVWNIWIIYPLGAWAFLAIAFGLAVHLRKPISEGEIQREIARQSGARSETEKADSASL